MKWSGLFSIMLLHASFIISAQPSNRLLPTSFMHDMDRDMQADKIICETYWIKQGCKICPVGREITRRIRYSCLYSSDTVTILDLDCTDLIAFGIDTICDINGDSLPDLIYFEKNKTSSRWIVVINEKNAFRAIFLGYLPAGLNGSFDDKHNLYVILSPDSVIVLAKWVAKEQNYAGQRGLWIKSSTAAVISSPHRSGHIMAYASRDELLVVLDDHSKHGWIEVKGTDYTGWIKAGETTICPPSMYFK